MPISKSAKKAYVSSERKRQRNKQQEIELEKALKSVKDTNINDVISKIDKSAKTNLIPKNKAARLKSRLTKKYGTPKATPKPKTKSSNAKSSKKSK